MIHRQQHQQQHSSSASKHHLMTSRCHSDGQFLPSLRRGLATEKSVRTRSSSSSADIVGLLTTSSSYFFTLGSILSRGISKIRSITKNYKISWNDLTPHQQSSHEEELR